jgi:hypothetical protein
MNKKPEDIIINMRNSSFKLDNYLECETMGVELIEKFTKLLEKVFECNSMKTYLRWLSDKLEKSKFLNQHLYNYLIRQENRFNLDIIKAILKIIYSILHYSILSFLNLHHIKDRLEILIRIKLNDKDLVDLFDEIIKLEKENLKILNRRKNLTFSNLDDNTEPLNDFTELSIVPKLSDIICKDEQYLRKNYY